MTRRRILGIAVIGFLFMAVVFVIHIMADINRSPLRAGATADDAWTYIHTNSSLLGRREGSLPVGKWSTWHTDVRGIEHETCFYWGSKRVFARRKTVYGLNTNGIITGVHTQWKFEWPFR
jgi:hypothetical protein